MRARKKRETMIIILVVCIVLVAAVAGMFGKKAYAKHKEAQRQEKIDAKLDEIQGLADAFDKAGDRDAKLKALQNTVESYDEYQKHEGIINDCIKLYESNLTSERKYFEDDYNNTISASSVEDVNAETDKDKLNTLVTALTELKKNIQTEYDTYGVVSEEKYTELNTTIDGLIASYTDRITAIDTEKQQAEEAQKQQEEEAAKKKQQESESKKSDNSNSSSDTKTTKKKSTTSSSSSNTTSSNSSSTTKKKNTTSGSGSSSSSGNSGNNSSSNANNSNSSGNTGGNANSNSNSSSSSTGSSSSGLGNQEGGYWYIDESTGELYN